MEENNDWWPEEARLLYHHSAMNAVKNKSIGETSLQNDKNLASVFESDDDKKRRSTRKRRNQCANFNETSHNSITDSTRQTTTIKETERPSFKAKTRPKRRLSQVSDLVDNTDPQNYLRYRSLSVSTNGIVTNSQTKPKYGSVLQKNFVFTGGTEGSGKSALIENFFSSNLYEGNLTQATFQTSADNEKFSHQLVVKVNEYESHLIFDDFLTAESKEWEGYANQEDVLHVFLAIYSVVDPNSFQEAKLLLKRLYDCEAPRKHVIILVANKSDLVRARHISTEEGSLLADKYNAKFIECSSGINHKVDDLLAGIITQLHLHNRRATSTKPHHGPFSFVSKLLKRRSSKCDNLFV